MAGKSLEQRKLEAAQLLIRMGYKVEPPEKKYREGAKAILASDDWQVEEDAGVDIVEDGAWVTVRRWVSNDVAEAD